MRTRNRKIWRPLAAKRAEVAAEAARKRYVRPKAETESTAGVKRKAKGIIRLPRRLTALS
ncbi:MAG TPA: hypothetical protein VHG92_09530 [Afifellaceae bacterium]|nr:hypothetical protein [Afifellaceae bacterium]